MGGNRQRWAAIGVGFGTLGLFAAGFFPALAPLLPNYLTFLTITIPTLILGGTIDSGLKINHQTQREKNTALIEQQNLRNQGSHSGDEGYE